MSADGDCFLASFHGVRALVTEGVDPARALIAQGLPVLGDGAGEHAGKRYWHSWVEVHPNGAPWHVIDVSNNLRVGIPRTRYYRLGKIDPAAVLRFTLAEAVEAMNEYGTYGPWTPGWETMEHPDLQEHRDRYTPTPAPESERHT